MIEQSVIVIAGIQHVGKTTTGGLLAGKFGCSFYDTDLETERLTGSHPREITAKGGQVAYNIAETSTIRHILSEIENSNYERIVISTGGGFCDNPKGISLLKKAGIIVCLDADLEIGFGRILKETVQKKDGSLSGYPIYPGYENIIPKTIDDVRKIYYDFQAIRITRYKNIADIIVPVDASSPEENMEKVLNSISGYQKNLYA